MKGGDLVSDFVREALASGRDADEIGAALAEAGWTPSEIAAALDGWSAVPGLPPVPRPRAYVSAGEALLYGLLFLSLAMICWHVVMIGFGLIETVLPDPLDRYGRVGGLRWSVASLVAFVPLFFMLNRRVHGGGRDDPARRRSLVRRWVAAITLMIAVLVLLGDLVAVVYALLNGDLTARFLAKALWVALIGGLLLAYYREEWAAAPPGRAWASIAIVVLGVAAIVTGLLVDGGPGQGRAERRDQQRLSDLNQIGMQAECLARDRGALSPDVSATEACPLDRMLTDPLTDQPYFIEQIDPQNLRICAVFETLEADGALQGYGPFGEVGPDGCLIVYVAPDRNRSDGVSAPQDPGRDRSGPSGSE